MKDEKFRISFSNFCNDNESKGLLFENPSFDNSIIGIAENGTVVYSYELMVEELSNEYLENQNEQVKDKNEAIEDAVEWIDYNTIRSLPYCGEGAPIIIMETKESIKEKY